MITNITRMREILSYLKSQERRYIQNEYRCCNYRSFPFHGWIGVLTPKQWFRELLRRGDVYWCGVPIAEYISEKLK